MTINLLCRTGRLCAHVCGLLWQGNQQRISITHGRLDAITSLWRLCGFRLQVCFFTRLTLTSAIEIRYIHVSRNKCFFINAIMGQRTRQASQLKPNASNARSNLRPYIAVAGRSSSAQNQDSTPRLQCRNKGKKARDGTNPNTRC